MSPAGSGLRAFGLSAAIAAVTILSAQESQQPPPGRFRTGTNIIRVDATVVDRDGNPVPTLTADDFEIHEDGALQAISSFKFISANGEASDDRSLPIRSQAHAATEAAREDVRTFLIFWDEYHIEQFVGALHAREGLQKAVMDAFGPTDLVALMDQLTPIATIEFTRDRRAMSDRIHKLEGRRGVYIPPRSVAEEEQLRAVNYQVERLEFFRSQVTARAIKAAAAQLGTLGEGRKTLIIVSQGFRLGRGEPGFGEETDTALDIIRTANDSNVAIHIIDPRGLQTARVGFNTLLDSITADTGGQLHRSNDITVSVKQTIKEASAVYLLGYTREMPMDGRFHNIKVRVKRRGYDVRARSGYWAPRAADVERAKTVAAAAVLPPEVAGAFASLTPTGAPRLVDVWMGTRASAEGRRQVTLAWTPRKLSEGQERPARVSVVAKSAEPAFEGAVQPAGTTFDAPAGALQLVFTVYSEAGEVLDRESKTIEEIDRAAGLFFHTPVVYRARNPAEVRAIQESPAAAPIEAGRDFVRTDRLFVRVSLGGTSSASASLTARLMDRRGANLTALPVQRAAAGDVYQVDLPLGSIAAGEFMLAFDATSGPDRAQAMVAFRVNRTGGSQ